VKKTIHILIFLLFSVLFSCERSDLFVICSDCTEQEPQKTDLKIKLDTDFPIAVVKVYEGNIDDSILVRTLTTNASETSVSVTVNRLYSITATYKTGKKSYVATDSARPGVKYDEQQCDNPCYYVYNRTVNLKIKYLN
jgi:hypothetical protein